MPGPPPPLCRAIVRASQSLWHRAQEGTWCVYALHRLADWVHPGALDSRSAPCGLLIRCEASRWAASDTLAYMYAMSVDHRPLSLSIRRACSPYASYKSVAPAILHVLPPTFSSAIPSSFAIRFAMPPTYFVSGILHVLGCTKNGSRFHSARGTCALLISNQDRMASYGHAGSVPVAAGERLLIGIGVLTCVLFTSLIGNHHARIHGSPSLVPGFAPTHSAMSAIVTPVSGAHELCGLPLTDPGSPPLPHIALHVCAMAWS